MKVDFIKHTAETNKRPYNQVFNGSWYNYGQYDQYPQNLIYSIANSSSAKACVRQIAQYTYSGGLLHGVGTKKANKDQNNNQLFQEMCQQLAYFEACAVLVRRYPLGGAEAEVIPFENVRIDRQTKNYVYNEGLSTRINSHTENKQNVSIKIPPFKKRNGFEINDLIESQKEEYGCYYGELIYLFESKPGAFLYPMPDWVSGLEDVKADTSAMNLRLESLENSFMPGGMLIINGDNDGGEVYNEESGEFEDKKGEELQELVNNHTGSGNRQGILVLSQINAEQAPQLVQFDNKATIDGLKTLSEIVPTQVARAFGVPDLLIGGFRPGALGNATELETTIPMFYQSLDHLRHMALTVMRKVWPELTFEQGYWDAWGGKYGQKRAENG